MNDPERRSTQRRAARSEVVLMLDAGSLAGHAVNITARGALVQAEGQITIRLSYEGKEFRGRLVHATMSGRERIVCGIQLDHPIE